MLDGYIDESADDKQERYAAAGGVLGIREQMNAFLYMWLHETHGLAQPFHATDCETGHGQFKNWPLEKRVGLMTRLVSLLIKQKVWGCAIAVSPRDYRSVFVGATYEDAMQFCLTSATVCMGLLASSIKDRVAVVYERGPFTSSSGAAFQKLRQVEPWKGQASLYSYSFEPKTTVALQAADLVAREAFKHFDNLGQRPTRIPFRRLSEQYILHGLHADGLRRVKAMGYPENLGVFANALVADVVRFSEQEGEPV